MTLYLSRLRLARNPQVAALAQLLNPDDPNRSLDAHHRLLWSAFATAAPTPRDFLWRHDGRAGFIVLSARAPQAGPFFEPPQVCEFAPALQPGDRLAFALRANATRTRTVANAGGGGEGRKVHVDLVMNALHAVPPGERAQRRMALAQEVATQWLGAQGERCGFQPVQVDAEDYSVLEVPLDVRRGKSHPRFGVLELSGLLTVTQPELFLPGLAAGFGRAKAFGCGLMLIRRA